MSLVNFDGDDGEDIAVVLSDSEDEDDTIDLTIPRTIVNGVITYFDSHGRIHRDDGPAIVTPTTKYWYFHGVRHRDEGPAVVGPEHAEYWTHGTRWGPASAPRPLQRPTRTFLR